MTGRSANRGECAQVCRSSYDLVDESGNILVKNSPLLSLKDMDRSSRIEDLIDAGITSFKIEGRLKNISYIKNIVRKYDLAIDKVIDKKRKEGDDISRAAWGKSRCTFTPDAEKTFNRGYTDFNLDGKREDWKSRDSAKSMGEYIGKVTDVKGGGRSFVSFYYTPQGGLDSQKDKTIHNSDGLCFVSGNKISSGNRASRCFVPEGKTGQPGVELFSKDANIKKGDAIYRNFDCEFEKQLENTPKRMIDISLKVFLSDSHITIQAEGDGICKAFTLFLKGDRAENPETAVGLVKKQLGKTALHFSFTVESVEGDDIYFYKTSALNTIRNELAENLDLYLQELAKKQKATPAKSLDVKAKSIAEDEELKHLAEKAFKEGGGSYLRNCSNSLSREIYTNLGLKDIKPSYEQVPPKGALLMRCKYCIRYQIGLCKKESKDSRRLYLKNGNNTLALEFDCARCEMLLYSVFRTI